MQRFDDIRAHTALFVDFPEVLDYYQHRFKYILVDEYQDTIPHMLVNMLLMHHNICVVGDDDQSYGWRGANIRNI